MHTVVLEFDERRAVDSAVEHLWDKLNVSGELLVRHLPEGRFRLEVICEKTLQKASIEKLGGRLIEA